MPLAPPSDAPGAVDGQYRRLSLLLHQALQLDYVGGTDPQYVGWAEPGTATSAAKWRIAKLTFDANHNVTQVQWAGGTIAYNAIWDNHTSLSYS
jgi:hypothetical protein